MENLSTLQISSQIALTFYQNSSNVSDLNFVSVLEFRRVYRVVM